MTLAGPMCVSEPALNIHLVEHYTKTLELVENILLSRLPMFVSRRGRGLTSDERQLIAEHLAGALQAFVEGPEQW